MTGFPLSAVREENRVFEGESPGNSPTQSIVNLPSDPDEPHRLFEDKSVQAPPWILRPATWDGESFCRMLHYTLMAHFM